MVQATTEIDDAPLDEYEGLPTNNDPKGDRCYYFSAEPDVPRCYSENTSKEELVLEHVVEYARQFKIIYDPTRELLLAPTNECGKRKFICTTIRPTKLPFTSLYNYQDCAKFVANYLEYEELPVPDTLPECIPSPANVLDLWQIGDCLDFAIVLCSLLIGVGYNAYVVYGTAPKSITTKDESDMDCPFSTVFEDLMEDEDHQYDADEEQMIEKVPPEQDPIKDGFNVETKPPHKSDWDNDMRAKNAAEATEQARAAVTIDDDEKDYEKDDKYGKSRIHAWVLILRPDREMNEDIYIEPTTGRTYALDAAPYHSIEGIFNHKNFYINLDPTLDPAELLPLDFKNDSSGLWEYVMLEPGNKKDGDEEQEENDEDEEEDDGELEEEPLDMPPPWSPKLFVDNDKFNMLCKGGEKTVFYRKCKVEIFSDCRQVDGLVKRITLYKDFKRLITQEIRGYYACRKDKLVIRRRFPYEFKLIEHYESSLNFNHWKKMIRIDGRYRKLYFYHHRQKDGLILREEFFDRPKNKIIEQYKNRPDKLTYRSVTFSPDAELNQNSQKLKENNYGRDVLMNKMTQKFELDTDLPAANQIKKTEFNIKTKQTLIYYHYEEGKITTRAEEWDRDDLLGHQNIDNDKDQEESKDQQIKKKYFDLEVHCQQQINSQEQQMFSELQQRQESEQAINQQRSAQNPEDIFVRILDKSIYAKARDKMKMGKKNEQDDTTKQAKHDPLATILKKCGFNDGQALDEEAAIQVKNEALRSLKERLLTRATIIQRRLDQEQKNLEQAYQRLKRKGDVFTAPDQELYEKEVATANFRMDILTERASQHYKNSLEKFQELDRTLMDDERLKVLNKNKPQ